MSRSYAEIRKKFFFKKTIYKINEYFLNTILLMIICLFLLVTIAISYYYMKH